MLSPCALMNIRRQRAAAAAVRFLRLRSSYTCVASRNFDRQCICVYTQTYKHFARAHDPIGAVRAERNNLLVVQASNLLTIIFNINDLA